MSHTNIKSLNLDDTAGLQEIEDSKAESYGGGFGYTIDFKDSKGTKRFSKSDSDGDGKNGSLLRTVNSATFRAREDRNASRQDTTFQFRFNNGRWVNIVDNRNYRVPKTPKLEFRQFQNRSVSPTGAPSDRRIKTDLEVVGFLPELGINLYSWKYCNNDITRYVGVMAQDLLARPDLAQAVITAQTGEFAGFYAVNYSLLGLRMITEFEWKQEGIAAVHEALAVYA